jgi:hypothetical protein
MWQDIEGVLLAEGQNYCNTGAEQTATQAALSPAPTEYPEYSYYQHGNSHHSVMCEPSALPDDVTSRSGLIGSVIPWGRKKMTTYRCTYAGCGKTYKRLSYMKLHLRIHRGEKPYHCIWKGCGLKFSSSGDFNRHYRYHTSDRPFQCLICKQAFSRPVSLALHMKRHIAV